MCVCVCGIYRSTVVLFSLKQQLSESIRRERKKGKGRKKGRKGKEGRREEGVRGDSMVCYGAAIAL